jgi:hypothetical protein
MEQTNPIMDAVQLQVREYPAALQLAVWVEQV